MNWPQDKSDAWGFFYPSSFDLLRRFVVAIAKRIVFFTLVNILVIASITVLTTVVCALLGVDPAVATSSTIGLIIFSAVFGMGGSIISLFMSKWIAKRMMKLQMIEPTTTDPQQREIIDMVHAMARRARLPKMPEVGFYNSPEMNAFATGPSKSNSLVAVSSGLVNSLDKGELEAVIGHEVAHIANGDMVTLTLLQGIINTFVIFISRILANIVASQFERNRFMIQFALIIVMQIAFSMLGSIVVSWFSRRREFRADAGGAKYSSPENMINALKKLSGQTLEYDKNDSLAAFKISGPQISALFRSHPPLEQRIAALQRG